MELYINTRDKFPCLIIKTVLVIVACIPQSSTENPETPGELGIFSVLPGIIGLLQVNEALKVVTGAGEVLSGKLMIYNALNSQFVLVDIEKNPDNFITKNLITKFS